MMTSAGIATWQKKGEIADKWREAGIDIEKLLEKLPAKLLEHQAYLAKVEERKGTDGQFELTKEAAN